MKSPGLAAGAGDGPGRDGARGEDQGRRASRRGSDDFPVELWPLRRAYLLDLPRRATDQERLLAAALVGDINAREELLRQVHRVAGSAGTYGYGDLSAQASRLEQALHRSKGGALTDTLVAGARRYLEELRAVADDLASDPGADPEDAAPSAPLPTDSPLPPSGSPPAASADPPAAPPASSAPAPPAEVSGPLAVAQVMRLAEDPRSLLLPSARSWRDADEGTWVRRALLLSDDDADAAALAAPLRAVGVALTVAPTGDAEGALRAAEGAELVILDAGAGPASGPVVALLRRLQKALPAGTPLLFLTERSELDERVEVTAAGASLCLHKPLGGEDLLRAAQLFAPGPYVGCSVLVVDDDPQVVELVRHLLTACRVKVAVAREPQGFWAALSAERPALVLLDISLPGFTGFELCRAAKADLRFRDLPVVFLSARLSVDDRAAAFHAGADDYIPKPIAPAEFLARVLGRLRSTIEAQERSREREAALAALAAQHRLLQEEQERSESLLLNVLPEPIAARLKRGSGVIADAFPDVTVLFADLVGFTRMAASATVTPEALVALLNEVFSRFDRLAARHGLEKIKTIGDAYMVVGGLPTPRADHAEAVAAMALDMMAELPQPGGPWPRLSLRIGIHSGPVVAGVIGTSKFSYDVWGDTVNTASRLESHGVAGAIQVSEETYRRLAGRFKLLPRGPVSLKDLGPREAYLLLGRIE